MSGRKNRIAPYRIVEAQSTASNFTSKATDISFQDRVSLHIQATGTANGQLSVQASVDGVNWQAMTFSATIPALSGTGDNFYFDINTTAVPLIRINYVANTGTGTLNAWISAKES